MANQVELEYEVRQELKEGREFIDSGLVEQFDKRMVGGGKLRLGRLAGGGDESAGDGLGLGGGGGLGFGDGGGLGDGVGLGGG